ncbi:hypothetical protein K438DRAFT_1753991 [Mycena galopus ATCC 62051]|nr:hypothetical protein K438DRAFT_1753991 [Mycena galopus ATCC 62051]
MSFITTSPTFQEIFRVPLDNRNAPQTISLDVIVSTGTEIASALDLDLRQVRSLYYFLVAKAVVRFIESNEDQSNAQARRTRDSSGAVASSPTTTLVSPHPTVAAPPLRRNGSVIYLYPAPSTSNAALPGAPGGDDHDEPLPAYSRLPPVYSAALAPESLYPSGTPEFPSPDAPQFAPIRFIGGDRRETRQRRLVSAILDDDSEEERPELPIGDDTDCRRRKRCVHEEDVGDEGDEEERLLMNFNTKTFRAKVDVFISGTPTQFLSVHEQFANIYFCLIAKIRKWALNAKGYAAF